MGENEKLDEKWAKNKQKQSFRKGGGIEEKS